jgi:hypothetical protein
MKYEEMKEAIAAGTIAVGDDVWIVDYKHSNGSRTPVRNLIPTLARIYSNHDLDHNTDFDYAGLKELKNGYHFRGLKRNGEPRVALINPFIVSYNVPYEGFEVFFTEAEARIRYREQVKAAMEQMRQKQQAVNEQFRQSGQTPKKQDTFNEQYNLKLLEMQGLLS